MKTLSGYVDDAYSRWLPSAVNCCVRDQSPIRGFPNPMTVIHASQPQLVPPPVFGVQERPTSRGRELVDRSRNFASRASSRGSFSVRRKLNAYNGPRKERPRRTRVEDIGAPSDFRRVEDAMPRMADHFRPLELSIYMSENQLSPILPHFGTIDDRSLPRHPSAELSYPPAALTHTRSESSLSFSIPRKPVRSSSGTSSDLTSTIRRQASVNVPDRFINKEKDLPRLPPAARLRAFTEPPIYDRVKSALHEKYELEQRLRDIEVVIEERQSLYMSSRPTSRMTSSTRPVSSIYGDSTEPLPPIPPSHQSFADRVADPPLTQRPDTAPTKTVHIPNRAKSFTEASATFNRPLHPFTPLATTPKRLDRTVPPPRFALPPKDMEKVIPPTRFSPPPHQLDNTIPPPPLPLVLQSNRPPLRKKKSFSRVSNWLFPDPDNEHTRNISLDSVTNTPKPVTSRDGFYQCVDMNNNRRRMSTTSASTVSTLESEVDEPTVPTTAWTPQSSPGKEKKMDLIVNEVETRQDPSFDSPRQDRSVELTRVRTFGEQDGHNWRGVPGRGSVGVAF
ncbi:hypothetical protein BP6252_04411 [Coleophoma cylindrospora]|uniref:Uncharacterized protein n=1 Tax=Coleophoma cylindrospora TaxID=1849047 RepID=A0A3D8S0E5_9HELO|nr:hypothetical protein BP6252_04411 [Coleophoma cylindrospora]